MLHKPIWSEESAHLGKKMIKNGFPNISKIHLKSQKNCTDLKYPSKNASHQDKSNAMQQVPDMLKEFRL